MLAGKDLILATRKYAVEDRTKSWQALITTSFLLLVAQVLAIVHLPIILQLTAGLLTGLISARMFIIYHDYLHKSILQNSWLAKAIFTVFGLYMLAPVSIWKRSHDYHHAHNAKLYTSSIGSFPLVTKKEFLAASRSERLTYLFIRHPLTIFLGYIFMFLWGMCFRTLFKSSAKHGDVVIAIIFHFLLGGSIYLLFGWQSFLFGFIVPSLTRGAIGAYLFYAQHNFPSAKYKKKEDWTYEYAALNSSSYMKMSKLMHWFTGNIGYHHIHHMNARIPFYNLPVAFAEMKELQSPGTTSLSPKEIYRCLKLKVWDPDQGRMLRLEEVYN
jgi:omega-6 fatty acid desaturase (delta-12 desaturase)